jgi:hypothetical protein
MNERRTKERRMVYVQFKVPTGWRSLKSRDAGGSGSRHPSSLGIHPRPCVPAHHRSAVRGRDAGNGSHTSKEVDGSSRGAYAGACA